MESVSSAAATRRGNDSSWPGASACGASRSGPVRQHTCGARSVLEAITDDLTGLPNRRALYVEVPQRLAARPDQPRALLLLDLDKFKEVNDTLGHHVGDRLLAEVGARLLECGPVPAEPRPSH